MTTRAYSPRSLEYQAAYAGATYDGNDSNLDAMQTAADPVTVPPDTSGDVMDDAQALQTGRGAPQAQGTHGGYVRRRQTDEEHGESMVAPSCAAAA